MFVQQELLIKVGRWGKGLGVHVRLITGNKLLCPLGGRTDGHAVLDGLCFPVESAVGGPPHDSGGGRLVCHFFGEPGRGRGVGFCVWLVEHWCC